MKIEPLHDNVLVERDKVEEKKTPGGIYIPQQGQRTPITCTVIAVGPHCDKLPSEVKAGRRVVVSSYAGVDIDIDQDRYLMVGQMDILGFVVEV